jgi:muramoyltetrapeptide carboxypeptidase
MRRPPILSPGARVALVAPAGRIDGVTDVAKAERNVLALGWQPCVGTHAAEQLGYLAGADDLRLHDFNEALRDDSIDAVWCLRGGYGAMRLLNGIDYEALRARPKAVIGYSDATALHAAIGTRADIVTFHGPVARATLTSFAAESLRNAVTGADPFVGTCESRPLVGGAAEGRLAGGNLALLASVCGTPYAPDMRGTIVVIEDVHEPVYRIDRMLTQLRLAGLLDEVVALAFGHFTDIPEEDPDFTRPLDDILREAAESIGVPCVAGLPVGHVDDQWTIPLGARARLDADSGAMRLLD